MRLLPAFACSLVLLPTVALASSTVLTSTPKPLFTKAVFATPVPAPSKLTHAQFTKYDVRAAVKAKRAAMSNTAVAVALPALAQGGLLFGDQNATTTIVMFTDIECPFCKRFQSDTYPTLKKDNIDTGKVRFVVRHFPLSFHFEASTAAAAIVCARNQNEDDARTFYGSLMALPQLTLARMMTAASAADLNVGTLRSCMSTTATKATIDLDIAAGADAGVAGTPTFFVIGPTGTQENVVGAQPLDQFTKAIADVQR